MSSRRSHPPSDTPKLGLGRPDRRAREKIIFVFIVQAVSGMLIMRGYPLQAALAAGSAALVVAHESTRAAGRLRSRLT